VAVTLDMDADVVDWLKEQHLDWQQELNNLARFLTSMYPPFWPARSLR
jgi:uncharacterized protein (DUF4415 family)